MSSPDIPDNKKESRIPDSFEASEIGAGYYFENRRTIAAIEAYETELLPFAKQNKDMFKNSNYFNLQGYATGLRKRQLSSNNDNHRPIHMMITMSDSKLNHEIFTTMEQKCKDCLELRGYYGMTMRHAEIVFRLCKELKFCHESVGFMCTCYGQKLVGPKECSGSFAPCFNFWFYDNSHYNPSSNTNSNMSVIATSRKKLMRIKERQYIGATVYKNI